MRRRAIRRRSGSVRASALRFLEMPARFVGTAELRQEHAARGFAVGIAFDRRQHRQPGRRALGAPDRDGARKLDHRRTIEVEQVVIDRRDAWPVGLGRAGRRRVQ